MVAPRRYRCNWRGPGNLSAPKSATPPSCPRIGRETRSTQELGQILRVANGVVGITVVEGRVHLGRGLGHLAQVGIPGFQLRPLIEITKVLRRTYAFLLPGLPVAPVKADHPVRRRHGHHGRHARGKALRLVNSDISEAVILEELEHALTPLLFYPR